MEGKRRDYIAVAILLTLCGGFLDAYTYILRGGVFANAQTGNIVLIGVNIVNKSLQGVIAHCLPVIAFAAGILAFNVICDRLVKIGSVNRHTLILLFEAIIITAVGFIPIEERFNSAVNILISFVTAMQYGAFRKISDSQYATTMCTGMLRTACDMLYRFIAHHDHAAWYTSRRLMVLIAAFVVGCGFGCVFSGIFGMRSVWICALLLLAAAVMLVTRHMDDNRL